MKQVKSLHRSRPPHMVGDGFRVAGFIPRDLWPELNPFLLLDYVAPWQLLPTEHPRGVDVHPHKGFETVTLLWKGALAHADSSGAAGTLHPGDVQWMTAGSGILHKEFHEKTFSRQGGILHSAQLWINLPAAHKNTPPAYQDIAAEQMPAIELADGRARIRVIAGSMNGVTGPARTFTRILLLDAQAAAGAAFSFSVTEGDATALVVLEGTVLVNGEQLARAGELLLFEPAGSTIHVETNNASHLLLLSGEPLNEPIAAQGPFVMNTREEIAAAVHDYQAGVFGTLA
ncbi:MAG TPA: pirin family protein [Lacibacter sp.]|nr:pirin family protein [Lacibacter sp.]HMO90503.1 pirin family protein [Lacibacter sp.]HMP86602.1 pirin family protein [Lacibacter sp.]